VRVRIAVPTGGFGQQLNQIYAWFDENAGADGWTMTASGTHGVLNDAVAIFFADAAMAGAFVLRWCLGYRVVPERGVYNMREDAPTPRIASRPHKTF
jgi:hypothetical protein